jgi:hypothetical protein
LPPQELLSSVLGPLNPSWLGLRDAAIQFVPSGAKRRCYYCLLSSVFCLLYLFAPCTNRLSGEFAPLGLHYPRSRESDGFNWALAEEPFDRRAGGSP